MKLIVSRFILAVISASILWSCGGDNTPPTVPQWMRGEWRLVYYGFTKVVTLDYRVTFTSNKMIYDMGGCKGEASVDMDTSIPYYATSDYRITITSAQGCEWLDFESIVGAVDEGVIWGENEGAEIHRYSFRQNNTQGPFRWIYGAPE